MGCLPQTLGWQYPVESPTELALPPIAQSMLSQCRPVSISPALSKCPLTFHLHPQPFVKFTDLPLLRASSPKLISSMEAPPPEYRKNVGVCLINPANKKIFAASRLDIPGTWQMPQGGIDEGEDPRTAVIRELREETGITSAEIVDEVPYWLTYDFPLKVKEKLNKIWGTNYKGQAQKWFLLRFTGKEEEVNLAGDGSERPEFAEWSWMTPQQVIDLAVDFKKPVYEEALKVFAPHFQSDSSEHVQSAPCESSHSQSEGSDSVNTGYIKPA